MSWSQVIGHDAVVERFKIAAQKGRLVSTYLFVGPNGIGKRTFALKLAQAVFCKTNPPDELEPCGTCPGCLQVTAGSHPDLIQLRKPENKSAIPVEMMIGDREHRMQTGLCHDISLKPFSGSRKVAIIDDADLLNVESANALLKTLEEPPQGSILILLSSSQHRQLSTIVSRSQVVRFMLLTKSQVLTILQSLENFETDVDLESLAAASGGSVETAKSLADPAIFEFRQLLLKQLASLDPGSNDFNTTSAKFVEDAGKESAMKRARATQIADFAIDFYSQLQLAMCGSEIECDKELASALNTTLSEWDVDITNASEAIMRSMDFQRHVLSNANIALCIQSWYSDLAKLSRGELVS